MSIIRCPKAQTVTVIPVFKSNQHPGKPMGAIPVCCSILLANPGQIVYRCQRPRNPRGRTTSTDERCPRGSASPSHTCPPGHPARDAPCTPAAGPAGLTCHTARRDVGRRTCTANHNSHHPVTLTARVVLSSRIQHEKPRNLPSVRQRCIIVSGQV